MATKRIALTGICKWAKLRKPDEKYDNYQLPLYMDDKSWEVFKASGVQTKIKEDTDGKYTVLKRTNERFIPWEGTKVIQGPPEVLRKTKDGNVEFDGLIGNGSNVTAVIEVYDGKNGKGHRLLAVIVNELVEYIQPDIKDMPF